MNTSTTAAPKSGNLKPSRALIVDDDLRARTWLKGALTEAFAGIEVQEVQSVISAFKVLAHEPFDIILLDIGLPDGSGLKVLEWLRSQSQRPICIISTVFDDDQHLFYGLCLGAQGYVLKDESWATLADMLRDMLGGRPPLSPSVARRMLDHFHGSPPPVEVKALSPREREVLQLIAKGLSVARVAELMKLSRFTVQDHVKAIYQKLEVASRAEALMLATRLGLV